MVIADDIRKYIQSDYVEPARLRGEKSIEISSLDVHNNLGLSDRMPNVCQVLRGKKLQNLCNIRFINETRRRDVLKDSSTNIFEYIISPDSS